MPWYAVLLPINGKVILLMLWLIYLTLIALGLFLKNSKVYDVVVIAFMGFLAWANTDAADYALLYLPMYLSPSTASGIEPGWIALCNIGNAIGLSYNGFACLLTVISMFVIRWFGIRAGANSSLLLALFMVYPGLMSIIQFRQFVASAIGAVALAVFFSNGRHKYITFSAIVIAAFFIHRSAAILMLLLFWPILKASGKRGRVLAILALVCLCVGAVANAEIIGSLLFGESRTDVYLSASGGLNANNFIGGIKNVILIILVAIVAYVACRLMRKNVEKGPSLGYIFSWEIPESAKIIMFINITMIILIPLVLITNDFMRFERYAFTYALALFAMMPTIRNRHRVFSCKALYVAICLVFAFFYVANTFESVYGALLSFEALPPFFSS